MGLSTNLTSHWSLEEASGTRADDVVASGNDLSDNNTVTQAAGKIGNAAQFTAANSESLSRASNASLQTGNISFIWCAWVNPTTLPALTRLATKENEYSLFLNGNIPSFRIGSSGQIGSATTVSVGVWAFLVGWFDSVAGTRNIQVNNGTVASSSVAAVATAGNMFAIGSYENSLQFADALIDEVGFWKNYIPDATERTWLYNAGAGRSYAEIAAYEASGQPTTLRQSLLRTGAQRFGRGF